MLNILTNSLMIATRLDAREQPMPAPRPRLRWAWLRRSDRRS